MKIYQLFYTSCKKGLSSGMGFQTYSMSEGIKEEERKEIETHCFYTPPENLLAHPTEAEINEIFPISFSFFRLNNGKYCICRAKYKGKDYSGRFGNYFCHVLIMEEQELNFYPIEIYESPIFRDGLTEAEENADIIEHLPILENLPKGEVVTLENIEVFLKGQSVKKRTKSLNEIIDGIIDAKVSNKRILFCDKKSNLHFWIAAATMTLPVSIARSLTFNTYSFDTVNNLEFICGSLRDGTQVDFREKGSGYFYNLFNFEECYASEFNLKSKFAKQASLVYTIIKDYRKNLIDFIEIFKYKEVNADIDNCVNLLSLVTNGLNKLSEEEALKALAFANKYGKKDYFLNLILVSYKAALMKKEEQIIITVFNKFLYGLDLKEATEIRIALMEDNLGSEILISSFKSEIKTVKDKKIFFKNYCKEVFDNNLKYKTQCFSLVLEEFLKYFNYMDFKLEDYAWLIRYIKDERPNKILYISLCEKILMAFQQIVPIIIEDSGTQNLIEDMNDLKEWYFINLKLDIGEIMQYANQLYSGEISIDKFLINTRTFKFQGIGAEKYEKILKLMFSFLCPHLKDVACHSRLKLIFFYEKFKEIYFKTYMDVISDIFNEVSDYKEELKISYKKPYEIYLEAVYIFLKYQESLLEREKQNIKSNIIYDLNVADKIKLNNYNMYMYGLISNTTMIQQSKDISLHWEEIYEILSDNKKNFLRI